MIIKIITHHIISRTSLQWSVPGWLPRHLEDAQRWLKIENKCPLRLRLSSFVSVIDEHWAGDDDDDEWWWWWLETSSSTMVPAFQFRNANRPLDRTQSFKLLSSGFSQFEEWINIRTLFVLGQANNYSKANNLIRRGERGEEGGRWKVSANCGSHTLHLAPAPREPCNHKFNNFDIIC